MNDPNQLDQNEFSTSQEIVQPSPQTKVLSELEGFEKSLHGSKYINLKLLTALKNSLIREDLLGDPLERPVPIPPKDRLRSSYLELTNYGVAWVMRDLETNGQNDILDAIDACGFAYDKLSRHPSIGGTTQADDLIRNAVSGASDEFNRMQGKNVDPKHFLSTGIQKALAAENSNTIKDQLEKLLNDYFSTHIELLKMGNWWDNILNNARS